MARDSSTVRPKNLDLRTIRLPLPGIVSILHRISGALLFLVGIPLMLSMLQLSLQSEESFEMVRHTVSSGHLDRLALLFLIWSFMHHFFAGIRFLLLDIHKGVQLERARVSSMWVMVASIVLTILAGAILW